jgi:hypothetical protein
MRLSLKGIESIRRGLRRSWTDGTHRQRQQQREPDADTMRNRALWDRKGSRFADITLPDGQLFRAYWSTCGRTDQVDVFHDGRKVATCSPNRIFKEINR